jgi:outer membrane protein TolC
MRRASSTVVAALVFVAVAAASAPARATKYTFAELVAKVSRDAPGVISQREAVAAAKANLKAAQLAWMPIGEATLALGGTPDVKCLDRLHEDPALRTGPGQTEPYADKALREANCVRTNIVDLRNSPISQVVPFSGIYVGLTAWLNQPLFTSGKIEASIAGAKANLEAQEAAVAREQAEAVWNATRAYWGVKVTRAAIETLDEGIEKVKEWVDKIDEQISGKNQSRYTESDLARLKVALSNAEILLLDQKRNRFYAEQALKILTDDPTADVDDAEIEMEDVDLGLDEWQGRALRLRPEIRVLDGQLKGMTALRKQRLAELLPDLHLSSLLQYGYAPAIDTPQNWFLNRPNILNATFTLMLRQPLDFGVRASRLIQARHDEAANRLRRQASVVTFSTEIARAFADWEEAKGRVQQTRRGEKISRGWYNAVDQSLAAGLYTDGREMVESAQNYFFFRLRQLQAIFDANVALAWLRRTTGVTDVIGVSK